MCYANVAFGKEIEGNSRDLVCAFKINPRPRPNLIEPYSKRHPKQQSGNRGSNRLQLPIRQDRVSRLANALDLGTGQNARNRKTIVRLEMSDGFEEPMVEFVIR